MTLVCAVREDEDIFVMYDHDYSDVFLTSRDEQEKVWFQRLGNEWVLFGHSGKPRVRQIIEGMELPDDRLGARQWMYELANRFESKIESKQFLINEEGNIRSNDCFLIVLRGLLFVIDSEFTVNQPNPGEGFAAIGCGELYWTAAFRGITRGSELGAHEAQVLACTLTGESVIGVSEDFSTAKIVKVR